MEMKPIVLSLLLLLTGACAHKVQTDGGEVSFDPQMYELLAPTDLLTYAQLVVKRESREPENAKWRKLRALPEGQIKRIGLVVFETQLQPTRSGLASDHNVYLTERGKQILAENFYRYLEAQLRRSSSYVGIEWIGRSQLVQSQAFRSSGSPAPDFMLADVKLTDADILWKKPGELVPNTTLVHPRSFQDLTLLFVPAVELMQGPKMSQHQHQWVNDLCKELSLDAVLIVGLKSEWRRQQIDKRTKVETPEGVTTQIEASVLYPFGTYHKLLEKMQVKHQPKLNMPLATYSVKHFAPLTITSSAETHASARDSVLQPMEAQVQALLTLLSQRVTSDLYQTHP